MIWILLYSIFFLYLTSFLPFSSCWLTGFWLYPYFKNLTLLQEIWSKYFFVDWILFISRIWLHGMLLFLTILDALNLCWERFDSLSSVSKNKIFPFVFCTQMSLMVALYLVGSETSLHVFLPVHIKNTWSINLRYIRWLMNFHSKWYIKMCAYEGA